MAVETARVSDDPLWNWEMKCKETDSCKIYVYTVQKPTLRDISFSRIYWNITYSHALNVAPNSIFTGTIG